MDGTDTQFISKTRKVEVEKKINPNDEQTLTGTLTVTHLPSDSMVGEYTFED